ncbi:hypothetical protein INR49_027745 [Caranx melampygus]|nr:hypothetical protein INR49_027745 [Caranx melampygus]
MPTTLCSSTSCVEEEPVCVFSHNTRANGAIRRLSEAYMLGLGSHERDGCGEVLKEEAEFVLLLLPLKNEAAGPLKHLNHDTEQQRAERMIGHFSVLAAVLTVAITLSLSLLSLLCVRCRRKSTNVGKRIRCDTIKNRDIPEESSQDVIDDQGDYENVIQPAESLEHTYVAPIPHALYENTQTETNVTDVDPGVYANFIQSLPIKDDDDDYENSDFLEQAQQECEEPDYVNELGECT